METEKESRPTNVHSRNEGAPRGPLGPSPSDPSTSGQSPDGPRRTSSRATEPLTRAYWGERQSAIVSRPRRSVERAGLYQYRSTTI